MTWLFVSNILLLAVLGALALVVLSLARQIGILHERTAPLGLVSKSQGVEEGGEVPDLEVPTLTTARVGLKDAAGAGRWSALLFIAADCPICRSVLPAYLDMLRDRQPWLEGYWVSDGSDMPSYPAYAEANGIDPQRYLISQELALHLQVGQLPSIAIIDDQGRLVAGRVVQSARQLHDVFQRAETDRQTQTDQEGTYVHSHE
jgi:methylamine dehydrogenase accessory protein MauD